MTERNRYIRSGGFAILLGILLFFGAFYGLRAILWEGGEDADENMIAFAVGLSLFLVSSMFGGCLITIGLSKPKPDA